MKKLLLLIILSLITMLVVNYGSSETMSVEQFKIELVIDICEVANLITGVQSIELHLLYVALITDDYYMEIIDDEYG